MTQHTKTQGLLSVLTKVAATVKFLPMLLLALGTILEYLQIGASHVPPQKMSDEISLGLGLRSMALVLSVAFFGFYISLAGWCGLNNSAFTKRVWLALPVVALPALLWLAFGAHLTGML